jgi:hypothetical protein
MREKVRKISTLTLLNLDPEVNFHTNDVTLNNSIDMFRMATYQYTSLCLSGESNYGIEMAREILKPTEQRDK